jgi:ribosome-associated translation inhibitor RaiA
MNIKFHIRGLNFPDPLRHRFAQRLEELQELISISAAAVVLEHERDNAPAFRVYVLLAVPGPDIHAEARDHTLQAAWLKVATGLRKQIEQRKFRQLTRSEGAHQGRNGPNVKRGFAGVHNRSFSQVCGVAH